MKKREKQRRNRRLKEEYLKIRDICGVKDPTPYEAVKEIIREAGHKCTTSGSKKGVQREHPFGPRHLCRA